jgi:glycosyltransferase involved in cell wall biosynthesis
MGGLGRSQAATVSVCLCTWNGERYLPDLLASLSQQSRPPDEVVVCDDGSTDRTLPLLEGFASEAPFPVRLHVNAERIGVVGNFERALTLAEGDVLLPCDQDDIWHPRKVELVTARLLAVDRPVAVLHNSSLVDTAGSPLPGTLWQRVGFGRRERAEFERCGFGYLISHALAAGHALAFEASTRPLLIPFSRATHYDMWIAQLLAANGRIALIDQTLVAYRLHDTNATGLGAPASVGERLRLQDSMSEHFGQVSAALRELLERLDERVPGGIAAPLRRRLCARAEHLERRATIGTTPRSVGGMATDARSIAIELFSGRYRQHSNGLRSAGADFLRSLRPS